MSVCNGINRGRSISELESMRIIYDQNKSEYYLNSILLRKEI